MSMFVSNITIFKNCIWSKLKVQNVPIIKSNLNYYIYPDRSEMAINKWAVLPKFLSFSPSS
jgi:hypothetical protein